MKQRVFYGDIHGCLEELKILYKAVEESYPGIEHWHIGDLVDRGENSGEVVSFVMKYFENGIIGNHEISILKHWLNKVRNKNFNIEQISNPDKRKTIEQLNEERVDYLKSLPFLHVFDDVKLIICHGGLFPSIPIHYQSAMYEISNNQMIHSNWFLKREEKNFKWNPTVRRWWGFDAGRQPGEHGGFTEEESRKEGMVRWYELYDHEYDCIFGHSVMGNRPFIYQGLNKGRAIGIDTGSCFGRYLTALIYPSMEYIQVRCKEYSIDKIKSSSLEENPLKEHQIRKGRLELP